MKPVTLIIMDGHGIAPPLPSNAVYVANTPNLDEYYKTYPHTQLSASGLDVGLPDGQMGNSEVGHTNIGAGRVVYQELTNITHRIETGELFENKALLGAVDNAKAGHSLHFFGLLSPGGVHSHTDHLYALLRLAKERGLTSVYVHCFLDGRDTPPESAKGYIANLLGEIEKIGAGKIGTVIGRFYAMDRDNRWERVEEAYSALVFGEGIQNTDPLDAMQQSYDAGVHDEFVKPIIVDKNGTVKSGDSVIFYNFRPDRAREITRAFVDPDFTGFTRKNGIFPLKYVCMTQYDETMPNVDVAYPPETPEKTIGEVVASAGLKQFRTAETEKYAHVTFFFNGGVEIAFDGEDRKLIPSPKEFPTYDLIPEMSARKVADEAVTAIASGKYDLIIMNFANCDMVGHTGVLPAAIKAVETVDECVGRVVEAVKKAGGVTLITADHGNAEQMLSEDGTTPHTAHTTNPVPFIVVGADVKLNPGRLCDISPTILELLKLPQPKEMTGVSLIVK